MTDLPTAHANGGICVYKSEVESKKTFKTYLVVIGGYKSKKPELIPNRNLSIYNILDKKWETLSLTQIGLHNKPV